ncbi:hypothetical protein SAHL_05030 [Salinisphaera orenii YIM 95161]|uniref:Sulfotransferase n=1 Tax=Salinisphaera orenii YIM 95161 TaxID=1051139 RepID=A0A423Q1Y4_9GAMM|nr:hypothetical protein SAHL_05030 [Salinisphaera halophila YIM 95161]
MSAERILHVPLSRLQHDPGRAYQHVQDFLGVTDDRRSTFPPANEARGHRSATIQKLLRIGGRARLALGINRGLGLGHFNERPRPKEALSDAFVDELARSFAAERRRLDALTRVSG